MKKHILLAMIIFTMFLLSVNTTQARIFSHINYMDSNSTLISTLNNINVVSDFIKLNENTFEFLYFDTSNRLFDVIYYVNNNTYTASQINLSIGVNIPRENFNFFEGNSKKYVVLLNDTLDKLILLEKDSSWNEQIFNLTFSITNGNSFDCNFIDNDIYCVVLEPRPYSHVDNAFIKINDSVTKIANIDVDRNYDVAEPLMIWYSKFTNNIVSAFGGSSNFEYFDELIGSSIRRGILYNNYEYGKVYSLGSSTRNDFYILMEKNTIKYIFHNNYTYGISCDLELESSIGSWYSCNDTLSIFNDVYTYKSRIHPKYDDYGNIHLINFDNSNNVVELYQNNDSTDWNLITTGVNVNLDSGYNGLSFVLLNETNLVVGYVYYNQLHLYSVEHGLTPQYHAPEKSVYLGFEKSKYVNVYYPYTGFLCTCNIGTKTVEYPEDWYVVNPKIHDVVPDTTAYQFDFLKMSSKFSYEGQKSLKMWYLPPQERIPNGKNCTWNVTTNVTDCYWSGGSAMYCENMTSGYIPEIRKNVNNSIFVEKNITLPTPYISLSFKVRKCLEPELKSSAVFLCNDNLCYTNTQRCDEKVYGSISTYIKDADTGEVILDATSDVEYSNIWETREYAIDSLEPNKTYTIGFGILPEYGEVDSRYYCVYLDDVNIDIRTKPLTCVSECVGLTRIERTCKKYDENGYCVICEEQTIENSPLCISNPDVLEKVQSCEDWCGCEMYEKGDPNYYTKYVGTIMEGCNITEEGAEKCCQWTEVKNSDYCKNYCAEKEQQEYQEQTPLTPLINVTEFEEGGLPPLFVYIFTPAIFSLLIAMSITVLISGKIQEHGKRISWQFAMVIFISLLGIFSLIGWFPIWFILILIIIAGMILIKFGGIFGGD